MVDPPDDHTDRNNSDNAKSSTDQGEVGDEEADSDEAASPTVSPSDEESSSTETISLGEAQERAREAATDLLEYEFEGVIKVEAGDEDGWRTVVELVERNAVPDTQDIIGRYEITLDTTGSVTGYELLERYRRGDMKEEM